MSLLYRLMYRLGVTPWDRVLPAELSDIVTGPGALSPGRALDLGSGQGAKAVFMADVPPEARGLIVRELDTARGDSIWSIPKPPLTRG